MPPHSASVYTVTVGRLRIKDVSGVYVRTKFVNLPPTRRIPSKRRISCGIVCIHCQALPRSCDREAHIDSKHSFSPKLQRRLTFYRRSLLEVGILLETDSAVIDFYERPGYLQNDGRPRLADFLFRYVDKDELATLIGNSHGDGDAGNSHRSLDGSALSIRRIAPAGQDVR